MTGNCFFVTVGFAYSLKNCRQAYPMFQDATLNISQVLTF